MQTILTVTSYGKTKFGEYLITQRIQKNHNSSYLSESRRIIYL